MVTILPEAEGAALHTQEEVTILPIEEEEAVLPIEEEEEEEEMEEGEVLPLRCRCPAADPTVEEEEAILEGVVERHLAMKAGLQLLMVTCLHRLRRN